MRLEFSKDEISADGQRSAQGYGKISTLKAKVNGTKENVEMESKFMKNSMQKKQAKMTSISLGLQERYLAFFDGDDRTGRRAHGWPCC